MRISDWSSDVCSSDLRYDANEPTTLDAYCDFLGITKRYFYDLVEPMRDPQIWEKSNGAWVARDSVVRHAIGEREERARVEPANDRKIGRASGRERVCQ